jgi:hypothetical protein
MLVMCFKKIMCGFQDREAESLVFIQTSMSTVRTLISQATFYLDDVVIPFELSSMSKSFKLFKVASVRTSQQHIQTPFSVR